LPNLAQSYERAELTSTPRGGWTQFSQFDQWLASYCRPGSQHAMTLAAASNLRPPPACGWIMDHACTVHQLRQPQAMNWRQTRMRRCGSTGRELSAVRIEGLVGKNLDEESDAHFHSWLPDSRIGATRKATDFRPGVSSPPPLAQIPCRARCRTAARVCLTIIVL
jgi:hypothetical protein